MNAHPLRTYPDRWTLHICANTLLAFATLLSLVLVSMIGGLSAGLFLFFGLMLVLRRPGAVVAETRDYVWIYLVPAWCLLTVLWSSHIGISLRYSVQLGITVWIAVTLAARLSPRLFVIVLFSVQAIAAVLSVTAGGVRSDGIWIGIFGSKNALAAAMSLLIILLIMILLDRTMARSWRLLALMGTIAGTPLLLQAQSAGALITTAIAVFLALVFVILHHLSPRQRVAAAIITALSALLLVLLFLTFQDAILATFFEQTGKDVTLTGRTELWRAALDEIARHPMSGQGYQAVWVVGNPIAEEMWALFMIPSKSGFHFHNTYLSNAVEIGIIGVGLQTLVILVGTWTTVAWAIRSPRAESLFLAIFMVRLMILSVVEVLVFFQFSLTTVVTVCAVVYGQRAREAALRKAVPPALAQWHRTMPSVPRAAGLRA